VAPGLEAYLFPVAPLLVGCECKLLANRGVT
jgi:hypothetical protein